MPDFSPKARPEEKIRADFRDYMRAEGWLAQIFHNDRYQTGVPDCYFFNRQWDHRWVDTKNPDDYRFTTAQLKLWPEWELYGEGVWIICAATRDEYRKLFQPPNWREYLRPRELAIVNWNKELALQEMEREMRRR